MSSKRQHDPFVKVDLLEIPASWACARRLVDVRRKWWLALGLGCAVTVALGVPAATRWWQLRSQVSAVECQVTDLKKQTAALNDLTKRLRDDPATIEVVAREHGMVLPGDVVLKFPSVARPAPSTETECPR